jgi:hypothetical protein
VTASNAALPTTIESVHAPIRHSADRRGQVFISSTAEMAIKPCAIPDNPQSPMREMAGEANQERSRLPAALAKT